MKWSRLLWMLALVFGTGDAFASERIFPQDRLSVKVLEWLPAKGEYKVWEGVTGEYTVALEQAISFPFVGSISTVDRSPDQLASILAAELQRVMSLPNSPDVTVNFNARAPVYVLGGVQTPGQIAFSAGLTPMKAVALAGGFFRGAGGEMRLERDAIAANAALVTAQAEAAQLTARLGRLDVEAVDGRTIEVVRAQDGSEPTHEMIAQEQALLDVRLEARQSQLESIKNRRTLAEDQMRTLQAQAVNLQTQTDLTTQELTSIKKLVGQGLAAVSRSLTLERDVSELQGRKLQLDIAILQAQLEANQADRDAVDVVTTFRTEVANSAQLVRSELRQRQADIDTARNLLREATVLAPEALVERAGTVRIGIRMFLTRMVGGSLVTTPVGKDELLEGGDTLQIELDTGLGSSAVRSEVGEPMVGDRASIAEN